MILGYIIHLYKGFSNGTLLLSLRTGATITYAIHLRERALLNYDTVQPPVFVVFSLSFSVPLPVSPPVPGACGVDDVVSDSGSVNRLDD